MCGGPYWNGHTKIGQAQALIIAFFETAVAFYWTAVCVHSYVALKFQKMELFTTKTMILTHVACLLYPLVEVIVTASVHRGYLGPANTTPNYYMFDVVWHEQPNWYTQTMKSWDFWWGQFPRFLCVSLSLLCIIGIFWELRVLGSSESSRKAKLAANSRVVAFLISYFFIFANYIVVYWYCVPKGHDIFIYVGKYVGDSIFYNAGPPYPSYVPQFNVGYLTYYAFTQVLQALVLALCFGLSTDQLNFYKYCILWPFVKVGIVSDTHLTKYSDVLTQTTTAGTSKTATSDTGATSDSGSGSLSLDNNL